jgi:hypothetical protein
LTTPGLTFSARFLNNSVRGAASNIPEPLGFEAVDSVAFGQSVLLSNNKIIAPKMKVL